MQIFVSMYVFISLGYFQGVELPSPLVILCLTARVVYKMPVSFYIPISNVWEFQILHLLTDAFYYFSVVITILVVWSGISL